MEESQKVAGTAKSRREGACCCLLLAPAAGPDLAQWPKVRCPLRLARPSGQRLSVVVVALAKGSRNATAQHASKRRCPRSAERCIA